MTCSWNGSPTPPCPAGGVNYGYDNNGNQTTRGSDAFQYDHENRLTQSVISGATSSSVYNGDGLRMSHTVLGQTTSYTWDARLSCLSFFRTGQTRTCMALTSSRRRMAAES